MSTQYKVINSPWVDAESLHSSLVELLLGIDSRRHASYVNINHIQDCWLCHKYESSTHNSTLHLGYLITFILAHINWSIYQTDNLPISYVITNTYSSKNLCWFGSEWLQLKEELFHFLRVVTIKSNEMFPLYYIHSNMFGMSSFVKGFDSIVCYFYRTL